MLHSIRRHLLLCRNPVLSLRTEKLLNTFFQKQLCALSTSSLRDESISSTENIREIPIRLVTKDKPLHENAFYTNKTNRTTFSSEEVNKFRTLANSWWDREGDLKPLHSLNKLRIALIRDGLITTKTSDAAFREGPQPLQGLRILDVGCGGGILCEPLARLGAEVTGLDASEESIKAAELHSKKDRRVTANVRYIQGTIEDHAKEVSASYDAIIASEVLEHVKSVEYFVETCVSLIKPGGSFFITTMNKTTKSWLGAIVLAEYALGILPRGTHDWEKFITPANLDSLLKKYGCYTSLLHGMFYFPIKNEWYWVSDASVNYALHAIKKRQ